MLREFVNEEQIYRIDHYLGKETVQNILVFRFANGIFEPIWNRRYIDHVQITVAEELGVEERGAYYEGAGRAARHVSQPPVPAARADCHGAAHLVRRSTRFATRRQRSFTRSNPSRARRSSPGRCAGSTVKGSPGKADVAAYRAEPKVAADSATETYAAVKLLIDSWRWAGVPFYLRSGKRLARRQTEIAIRFKCAPSVLFRETAVSSLECNLMVIRIQPEEGIAVRFGAKVPGPSLQVGSVDMDFSYEDYFGATPSTGYETLLYDCMNGDATLFQRADSVEAGWRVVMPILDVWRAIPPRTFPNYAAGSPGPVEADQLLARDGRTWRPLR